MKTIINNLNLLFVEQGAADAAPVVLIHGFPFSHKMWQAQMEMLKQDFRVIAPDVRGHGQSDVGDGQYSIEFFVDDLIGLLDHLKIEQAILCGLSMGGYIALRAVERHSDRVRALVLCDTRSEADSNEGNVKRSSAIRTIKTSGVPAFAEDFLKAVFASETFRSNPSAVELIRNIILSNPPLGICGTLLALAARTDTTPSLPNIKVPTLIMVGEKDTLTPPSASESMHAKIPGSTLRVIPDAAHMSNLENPEPFNKHLLEFLSKIQG